MPINVKHSNLYDLFNYLFNLQVKDINIKYIIYDIINIMKYEIYFVVTQSYNGYNLKYFLFLPFSLHNAVMLDS